MPRAKLERLIVFLVLFLVVSTARHDPLTSYSLYTKSDCTHKALSTPKPLEISLLVFQMLAAVRFLGAPSLLETYPLVLCTYYLILSSSLQKEMEF